MDSANGGWHLCSHMCMCTPPKICYKRDVRCISGLTFRLTVGWDTLATTTLPIGTAGHLIHINKRIFTSHLIFSSAELGHRPNRFGTNHPRMPKLNCPGCTDVSACWWEKYSLLVCIFTARDRPCMG